MTIKTFFASAVAAGALLLGAGAPAGAASMKTLAFLANVRPNIDFLDRSSRLAFDHSGSRAVHAFARGEAREQTNSANALVAWTQTNTVTGALGAIATADGVVPVVPVVGVASVPVGATDVATGRSVAVDVPAPLTVTRAPAATTDLLPAGQTDLDRLSALDGRAFDALYRSTQSDALHQLQTLYTSYIQTGDDPTLRDFAIGELPKVQARLSALRGI